MVILTDDAFIFMREVERHGIKTDAIKMEFANGQCHMTISEPVYRCPVCRFTATRFEDGEIQCNNRKCEVRPSTRYGKYDEADFTTHRTTR